MKSQLRPQQTGQSGEAEIRADLPRAATLLREYYRLATWSVILLVSLYSIGLRLYLAWDLPLWLDESWTAVLSSAPTFQSFADQIWLDSNAPLYYLLIWIWPFESNLWLKAPSLIFMLAAAAVAALWRPAGLRREAAWLWAFLLLAWNPGINLFIDARYYALLVLISTAQTIAYINLLDDPSRRRATVWTGLATLGILTHYFAAIPAIVQGLFYIWRHRALAMRTWPAALMTLPAFAWGLYHFPRLQLYALPEVSWYQTLQLSEVPDQLFWPVGGTAFIGIGVIAILLTFRNRHLSPNILATVSLAAASVAIMIVAGLMAPMFVGRYLLSAVPALLLGVAAFVRPAGYLPMAMWLFVNLGGISGLSKQLQEQADFGLQKPARLLPNATTVTWMIDYGGSKIHDRRQMEAMLADAFGRNGRQVETRWTNDLLGGDGLIWFYEPDKVPVVTSIKDKWHCVDLRGDNHSRLVCARRN